MGQGGSGAHRAIAAGDATAGSALDASRTAPGQSPGRIRETRPAEQRAVH
jgi:hypothetical protein